MAGPEPYPQEKWTVEQERAYAEGRANAQGASGKGPASRSAVRKKRVVRTEAGARRYGVPIGAEIGSARNAKAAEAQKDTESTDRYNSLVGTDPQAQASAMRGLNDDQLQRLSRVAYSWRTADPNVVRLRVGVANELRRRGMDVNNFGGLGRPQASAGPARRSSKPKPKPSKKKGKAVPGSHSTEGIKAAMSRMYGKDRKLSVPQLRAALDRFGHMRLDKREVVARFLVNQAVELSVPHFLGRSVIEAANLPEERQTEVIELAGRWKHGWIPLDAVAMRSKMKGGNGKPWWSGGKQTRRGSASSMRRSIEAGKARREGRTVPRTKTSNNKDVSKVSGGKPKPFVAVPKKGGQRNVVAHEEIVRKGGPAVPGTRRVVGSGGSRKDFVNNKDTKNRFAAKSRSSGVSNGRTDVVKSSPKPERGSKMDLTGRTESELNTEKRALEGLAARKQPTKAQRDRYAAIKSELARRAAGTAGPGTGGGHNAPAAPPVKPKTNQLDREIAELEAQEGKNLADWAHLKNLKARRAGGSDDATIAMGGSKAGQTAMNATPREKADNYIKMHGTAKARARLKALQVKEQNGKLTPKFRTEMDALKQALDADSQGGGSSGKA